MTAGTIFQDTRTPLTTWFRAMWWVTSQRTGASAKSLQQVLGLWSYETAWTRWKSVVCASSDSCALGVDS